MVRQLMALVLVLAFLGVPISAHASRDGVLDDYEVLFGAWSLLNFGKPKVAAANNAIIQAYMPQLQGFMQPLVDYAAANGALMWPLQATHEANQPRLVDYMAKRTVLGYGAVKGTLDDLWDQVLDPIVEHLNSVKTNPEIIALFDAEDCDEDDGECVDYEVNDLLADMCRTTLTVFSAFQTFQIASEVGGRLDGTDGTDILVSRGNTILRGGPGVDAFVVGWTGHMVIEDFEPEDKIVFPSDFFGSSLEEIFWKLSAVEDTPEGLHAEFYGGSVQITFRNVHTIDAFQVVAIDR